MIALPVLPGYTRFGGKHGESAAVANVLAWLDVRSPFTGDFHTEEMLFGLGGGLGFAYWLFDYSQLPTPMLSVGFRRFGWEGFDLEFVDDMCARAGAAVEVRETSSRAKASRTLTSVILAGVPALITADWSKMPGSPMPDGLEYVPHVFSVCGIASGETLLIDDLDPEPRTIGSEEIAAARCAVRSSHNRLRLLLPGRPPSNPAEAVVDAVADCAASLLQPARPNSGLAALQKWSRMVGSRVESKSWRKVFGTPELLSSALAWTARWIETGTGGGGFRPMYADFLDEAGAVLGDASLRELAEVYRDLGVSWSEVAAECLALAEEPERAFGELDALSDRLAQIHRAETLAAEGLRDAAGERMAARA